MRAQGARRWRTAETAVTLWLRHRVLCNFDTSGDDNMTLKFRGACLSVIALLGLVPVVHADVTLPSVIGSNMVLQRDRELPIWGWADAGEEVTVTFSGARQSTQAGADGKWSVKLPAMKASSTPAELTIAGKNTVRLDNILVGEVWLCSGQSNMEWTVQVSDNPTEEIAAADHPRIRHIKIPHTPADKPQSNVKSNGWEVCTPKTVPAFTAVGYYFALNLQKELDVPIGLIGSNWGGTRIEPWTTPDGFKAVPALKGIADKLDEFPSKNAKGEINHQTPLALYNGMIAPLVPYAIRGALWYQGESNNGEGMLYAEKMKALITGWRKLWNDESLPFYFVQLAPFNYGNDKSGVNLAGIWEAQTASLAIPHTGMAVTVDIGNIKDIHPRNKQDVGKRLALWALAKNYGKSDLVYSGPLYESMSVEGNKVRLKFKHLGGGLVARDGKPLSWFAVAGEDRKFVPALATIEGDTVVVHAAEVSSPVAVRYGWHQTAEPNLSNKAGLPASPFRTDNWADAQNAPVPGSVP
jgi:sialate O-acetylesterase